ncbi:MAG: hypothetical protein LRS47_00450 [Desulfurococcales archaeon]|nr:hypothetical protein [Desulfurococcales archaeon]
MRQKKHLAIATIAYLAYIAILLHPPKPGWDIALLKATIILIATTIYLAIVAALLSLNGK